MTAFDRHDTALPAARRGKHHWTRVAVGALFAAIAAYLLLRTWGTQPQIMADEWSYSRMSRLQELSESILPSWLYLWMARGSNACGARFYDCIHAANVLFMVAAAPFVYGIGRQVAGRGIALAMAVAATLAPLNLYTTYFMPETLYYFGFCVLSWVALAGIGWRPLRWSLALGVVLGVLSLIKVHALFLVPPLVLYMLYARWSVGGRWLLPALGAIVLTLAAAAVVKFGLGWLIAGEAGLHLLGGFYQANANSAGARTMAETLGPILVSAQGHLMVLAVLVPLPLAITLHALLRKPVRHPAGTPDAGAGRLQVWTLLAAGATVCITILFTASLVSPHAPADEGWRLHMRYYSFVLPLLWLIAAATLGRREAEPRLLLRRVIAGIIALLMLLALVKLPAYAYNPVDGPDIFKFQPSGWQGRAIIAIGLLTLLAWAMGKTLAARLFVYLALPLLILGGLSSSHYITARFNHEITAADRAGQAVLATVPAAERKYLTVAGFNAIEMIRAQFHIDDKDTELLLLDENAPIAEDELPAHHKWLLVMRKHAMPAQYQPVVATDEFSLYRISVPENRIGQIDFSKPVGGIVASVEGLSNPESFGAWSNGKQVVLHLNTALPQKVRLKIRASSYAGNAELPFVLRIGEASASFRVPHHPMKNVLLTLDTDGAQRSIVIEVPRPISPKQFDGSQDTRQLGIALGEIVIATPLP